MNASDAEAAVARWHGALNRGAWTAAADAMTDPVVVGGPDGSGARSRADVVQGVQRSGIVLRAHTLHPITERLLVVEEWASWPNRPDSAAVATVFRTTGTRVSAVLRFPDLATALQFADLHTALLGHD